MKKATCLILTLAILLFSCKKNDKNDDWTEEDQIFYDNVIALQEQAAENYDTWSLTMDSLEVINQLQQYFLGDPSVTSATIGGQGIAVQYSNGMRGGIFLDPKDGPVNDTMTIGPPPSVPFPGLNEKSLVNRKTMVLLNPSYWERSAYTDQIITQYRDKFLPKIGFTLETYKNEEANVDRFTQLSGYGIIQIYSHGWAWPKETDIKDVYLKTGEVENDYTTEKYALRMLTGDIFVAERKAGKDDLGKVVWKNIYYINEEFVASQNDFSTDTVLFYGGFCYSFLGKWPEIENTFAKGAYFGFDWSVLTERNADWASWLIYHLSDIATIPPRNPAIWMNMPAPAKSYHYDGRTVSINYIGDPTLTLFKDSLRVETWWPGSITQTTAEVRGKVLSEGGYPVTQRGICWSLLPNPTIADNYDYVGGGTDIFTIALAGLTPDTLYYVRAYAVNSKWTVYGNQQTFRTLANPASTVTTAVVTNITQTTATSGGNVTSDGGVPVTARGVCWSNLPDPTIADSYTSDGSGTGEFESSLTGLSLDTLYYVRAYATNSIGTVYGNQESFTTRPLYFIGQNYGGGLIFYIDGTGKHGLICAPTDQSTGARWGSDSTLIGTSTAIGAGQANTILLVNGDSEAEAARICNDLELNGYSDWFLPSRDELGQIAWQAGVIGSFTFMADYWSSSEYNSDLAYSNVVSQGTVWTMDKEITYYWVRAVRAF